MKLTVFHSDKGDCTLVTGADGKRLLADGGVSSSFSESVAPQLAKIAAGTGNKKIDIVYVSHIDDDHIGGVLKMLDDAKAWAIHAFKLKKAKGSDAATIKPPQVPRPPAIGEIWHNGFRELLKDNAGPIEDQLAASAIVLSAISESTPGVGEKLIRAVSEHQDLAESVRQAISLGRRVSDGELGIPLNPPAKGKLMTATRFNAALRLGKMEIFVIGPFEADLLALRTDWNKWLRANRKALQDIRAQGASDEAEFGNAVVPNIAARFAQDAVLVANSLRTDVERIERSSRLAATFDKQIGDRKAITPPNLASLMLLLREGAKTILLTGDGFGDDAVRGLERYGLLSATGGIHVDVLKVPHHGSEHNISDAFAQAVTADRYVFCGNGFSTNPEKVVIERFWESRLGAAKRRSTNPEAGKSFTFVFNCDSKMPNKADQRDHMKMVEKLVAGLVKKSDGKMKAIFMGPETPKLDFTI